MGNYVESNLTKNEALVKKAEMNTLYLLGQWIIGILFFWLLFIPTIKAIIATVRFYNMELAITNKRVVGKVGVFNTKALDAPLNKVQNVSVYQTLGGKIFNYSTISISTAAGNFTFSAVKNADAFKNMLLAQADQFDEDRIKQQASEMANAMATALNK